MKRFRSVLLRTIVALALLLSLAQAFAGTALADPLPDGSLCASCGLSSPDDGGVPGGGP